MDLGTIQGYFADFATFAKNIGTALQGIPGVINLGSSLVFDGLLSSTVEGIADDGSSVADAVTGLGSSDN